MQITIASFFSPHHTPLWNSSSEAITPRWRILDVITSICRFFYSHCEVTCHLFLTSPHNGQLLSTHQSLSTKNFDTQNLVEIIFFDNLKNSGNLLMCVIGSYSLHCVQVPLSGIFYACISKLSSALSITFISPLLMDQHVYTGRGCFWSAVWYKYCVKRIASALKIAMCLQLFCWGGTVFLSAIWKNWESQMRETDIWN